jgi:Tfp pilus assembly protein PilF
MPQPSTLRRLFVFTLASLIVSTGLAACQRGARLPDKSSKEYRDAVSAFYVGLAALQVGDDARAESKLKQVTEMVPAEPAAWADLGLLALRQKEFDAAAQRLEKARELAPDNGSILVLLGLVESGRGRTVEAIAHLRRAVELDPRNVQARYMLAQEIERQGDENNEAEIQHLLEQILEIQPDNLAAQIELTRIAAKRGDTEALRATIARLSEKASAWPPEVREQFNALKAAAEGPNVRQAASRVAFLRNVLARVPEYRQSYAAIKPPVEEGGEPITRFIKLPTPDFSPAPPDDTLSFAVEPLPGAGDGRWSWAGAISLNGEGGPMALMANGREVRLGNGHTLPFPGGPAATDPTPDSILGLDFNYDFKTDLVLAGAGGVRLFRQDAPDAFADVTAQTGLPAAVTNASYSGAWAADIDLDGDLDIVLGAAQGPPLVLRNNGDGTFKEARPFEGLTGGPLRGFVWADLDEDGDPDAAMLDASGQLHVYTNERGGQFRRRQAPQTGEEAGAIISIAAADVNHDGAIDIVALGAGGAIERFSDKDEGKGWTTAELVRWPDGPVDRAARFFVADIDNSGSLDLLVSGPAATRLWLSDKDLKFKDGPTPAGARILAVADLTGDGRLDLIGLSNAGQAIGAANKSAKNYHWQIVRTRAANATGDQRINSFGVGGEMEIRSGFLVQKQVIAGPLVHFGLGEQTGADVVRIIWPNGSVRAEFELKADQTILAEQRLKGSCPSLFAFDGRAMRFVKDCPPWSSALGLRINAQETADILQPEEWVKIRGDQLVPRDGFYDLRITAELWETYYIDHYALMVVDHPEETEIFVNESFSVPPPKLELYTTARPRPFAHAWDDNGQDVTEIVRELDDKFLDTFGRGAYQGVTRDHYVELELAEDAPRAGPLWLIGHGWMHPTDASINVAISQGSQPPPKPLSIEVSDGHGGWVVVRPNLGFPAGKAKTVLYNLTDVFRPGAPRRLRLRTNLEIFWDKLEWAAGLPTTRVKTTRLLAETAELRYRGFSIMNRADESSPEIPEYRLAGTAQRWRDLTGYYTRYGDIRELLAKADDRIVIVNAGDEMAFRFAAPPPPPAGWTRDFILIGTGWIKDGDYNSMFSATVLPLPDHNTTSYTTPPGRLEDDPVYRRHAQDWQDYHTRYITPQRFRDALRLKR